MNKNLLISILIIMVSGVCFGAETLNKVKECYTIMPFEGMVRLTTFNEAVEALKKCEGNEREECEEYIISTFEKVCAGMLVKEEDDFYRRKMWVEGFKDRYVKTFPHISRLRYDAEAHMRFARALGSIPDQSNLISNDGTMRFDEYQSYLHSLNSLRQSIIFMCSCRQTQLKKAMDDKAVFDPKIKAICDKKCMQQIRDEQFDKFVKEFADSVKMTREERDALAKRFSWMKLKW